MMIGAETNQKVREIEEATGLQLLGFAGLRKNASAESQIEALRRDREWHRRQYDEILALFDNAIQHVKAELFAGGA